MVFLECSGISWTICKQSAPWCRQITTPTHHHSIFTGLMLFRMPNQQCQSTEGTLLQNCTKIAFQRFGIDDISISKNKIWSRHSMISMGGPPAPVAVLTPRRSWSVCRWCRCRTTLDQQCAAAWNSQSRTGSSRCWEFPSPCIPLQAACNIQSQGQLRALLNDQITRQYVKITDHYTYDT